jgi:hypothetical protein
MAPSAWRRGKSVIPGKYRDDAKTRGWQRDKTAAVYINRYKVVSELPQEVEGVETK